MTSEISIQALQPAQINALLELLEANLKTNLAEGVAEREGFLTFLYDVGTIQSMMRDMPQPIVTSENRIVAYALAATKEICIANPLLKSAIDVSDGLLYNGKLLGEQKFYVMGQICIAESFRGIGLFAELYLEHKRSFSKDFSCVVTEISDKNVRSLKAHLNQGFQVVGKYSDGETNWLIVAWDWK